ncbi:hypothetical protein BDZ89DRAFT_1076739 [Hymenopellis radicata]|nr:hypothetical protein BDZ89DRAFT_1076739 [Hymenopellis radicata]
MEKESSGELRFSTTWPGGSSCDATSCEEIFEGRDHPTRNQLNMSPVDNLSIERTSSNSEYGD